MDYILTEKQIDKIMNPFWDFHFGSTEFTKEKYSGAIWEGFFKSSPNGERIGILCRPLGDYIWYFDGQYFLNNWNMFNITPEQFKESMKRYVKNTYDIEIESIM